MNTEIQNLPAVQQGGQVVDALSAAQMRSRVNLIQEVMRAVMKEGTHFGKIPGAGDKPTLLKPGSEVLNMTFHIAVDPLVDDLSTSGEIRYRVRCRALHQDTGILLGVGVGEASSNEEKYKWRAAVCDEEFDETPVDMRRVKYGKRKDGSVYTVRQVRTNPADIANTVLKMAKKRAQVDMTLTVTGASDIFTQDIEDMPPEIFGDAGTAPRGEGVRTPQSKSAAPKPANSGSNEALTEGQGKLLYAKLKAAGFTEQLIKDTFDGRGVHELKKSEVNAALELIAQAAQADGGNA